MNNEEIFSRDQLRGLDVGRLAVLNLVIRALVETHPNPQELLQAFRGKADGAKTLMRDLQTLYPNPVESRKYPSAFQELLDDDLALWTALLERRVVAKHP